MKKNKKKKKKKKKKGEKRKYTLRNEQRLGQYKAQSRE
jgi:hypothetical protein